MISGELKWYTVAETLRAAIHADLTDTPDRSGVVPGAVAWDACDCGILAVSVGPISMSDTFPEEITTRVSAGCDAAWEVGEILIQIIRCAPNPDGQDLYPTVAELDASAREVARDAYETLRATSHTLCAMRDADDIVDFVIRPQTPQGPAGGCVGTELRVLVGLERN